LGLTAFHIVSIAQSPEEYGLAGFSGPNGRVRLPCDIESAAPKKSHIFLGCALPFSQTVVLIPIVRLKRGSTMTKRFLTLGLAAIGLTGFVMASQWGYAAEPPAYPVRATPEMMQLVRDEHDLVADMIKAQLAAERDRYAEQRTAITASPSAVGTASAPRAPSSGRGRRNS
jgi:hypothetical protein